MIVTGLVPYDHYRGVAHPVSFAVEQIPGYQWLVTLINVGALFGLTSVVLVTLLGQPRIFYSMAVSKRYTVSRRERTRGYMFVDSGPHAS